MSRFLATAALLVSLGLPVQAQAPIYKSIEAKDLMDLTAACNFVGSKASRMLSPDMTREETVDLSKGVRAVMEELDDAMKWGPNIKSRCMVVATKLGGYLCMMTARVALPLPKPSIPLFHGDWMEVSVTGNPFKLNKTGPSDGNYFLFFQDTIFNQTYFDTEQITCMIILNPGQVQFKVIQKPQE